MGYTHYWELKVPNEKKFKKAVELFKKCWEVAPKKATFTKYSGKYPNYTTEEIESEIRLFGGDGTGEPVITDTRLLFNGEAELGGDHETFDIDLAQPKWDFCKTARKPYDLAVCLALLSFKKVFGKDFTYSSDGVTRESIKDPENIKYWKSINWTPKIEDEWLKAYEVFDKVTGLDKKEPKTKSSLESDEIYVCDGHGNLGVQKVDWR